MIKLCDTRLPYCTRLTHKCYRNILVSESMILGYLKSVKKSPDFKYLFLIGFTLHFNGLSTARLHSLKISTVFCTVNEIERYSPLGAKPIQWTVCRVSIHLSVICFPDAVFNATPHHLHFQHLFPPNIIISLYFLSAVLKIPPPINP